MSIESVLKCNQCGETAMGDNIYAQKDWITLDGELVKGLGRPDPDGDGYIYCRIITGDEPQHFCSIECLLQSLDGD